MQHNRDKPCGMMSADEPSMGGEPRIVGSVGADAIGAIGDAVTADVSLLAALHNTRKHLSTCKMDSMDAHKPHGSKLGLLLLALADLFFFRTLEFGLDFGVENLPINALLHQGW